jgi:ribonuclease VapC
LIVDTSALVAILRREEQFERMLDTLLTERAALPTPVLVEFRRVTSIAGNEPHAGATALLARLTADNLQLESFTPEDAGLAAAANPLFGTGNGRGGRLNMLDLMVYAVAKRMDLPVLCTGRDFAATDISLHPASRLW